MGMTKSVRELCVERDIGPKDLAARAGLDDQRALAIIEGRWLPSPSERDKIAAVFGLTRELIAWGHKNPIAHVYGHGPQFGRSP